MTLNMHKTTAQTEQMRFVLDALKHAGGVNLIERLVNRLIYVHDVSEDDYLIIAGRRAAHLLDRVDTDEHHDEA